MTEAAQITMTYRNWRGEVGTRTILPRRLRFDSTEWHPQPGWLLEAWDFDKGAIRDFALADCQFADLARPSQAGDEGMARLVRAAERFAGWTIGGKVVDDPENREKYPLLVAEVLELRAALAAMDTPKGGGDE